MNPADWIGVAGMAFTLLLNLAGYLVAWGVLKSTVRALTERVASLEAEAGAVAELRVQIAKIETRLDGLLEQFRDLNSAIRWMRADTVATVEPGSPRRRGRT